MLYDRWRQIVRNHKSEIALHDLTCARTWTFAQLDAAVDQAGIQSKSIVYPQGLSVHFLISLLSAWKENTIACPLEVGNAAPCFESLPTGCAHLKLTSATTGASRAIAFKGEQLLADVENIIQTMGLRFDWPNLGVISLAHS